MSAQQSTTQQPIDINAILQSLGGLGNLGGLLDGLGGSTTTGTTTTGTTTTGTTTGTNGDSQTAPGIVANQFTTTSSGALNARTPGAFLQQAIALQNGSLTLPGTPAPAEPNFFKDTAQLVAEEVLNVVKGIITAVNTGLGVVAGIPTTGGTITIPNAATTGTGTTTTIP